MVDLRERWNDQDEAMRVAADRHQGIVWTAMPVRIIEDSKSDDDGNYCRIQITIKGQKADQRTGEVSSYDYAPIGMVPIQFAAGGGLTITHPVKQDDEGFIVFQSRCIDGWYDKGGQQEEPYRRRHAFSDPIYVPGVRNKPRKLKPKPSPDAVHIRVDDGKHYIEMHKDGSVTIYATKVNVHAPEIWMDGNSLEGDGDNLRERQADTKVDIKGTLHVTKDINGDQNIIAQRQIEGKQEAIGRNIKMTSHRHTGVMTGQGTTGAPVPGS